MKVDVFRPNFVLNTSTFFDSLLLIFCYRGSSSLDMDQCFDLSINYNKGTLNKNLVNKSALQSSTPRLDLMGLVKDINNHL